MVNAPVLRKRRVIMYIFFLIFHRPIRQKGNNQRKCQYALERLVCVSLCHRIFTFIFLARLNLLLTYSVPTDGYEKISGGAASASQKSQAP